MMKRTGTLQAKFKLLMNKALKIVFDRVSTIIYSSCLFPIRFPYICAI